MPDLMPLSENNVIWAEEVEEESRLKAESHLLPAKHEVIKDGIKTVTEYYKNDDDQTVKCIYNYKIETKRVSSAVANRKKLSKFGQAKSDPPGPNTANTSIGDTIKIQFVRSRGGDLLELTKNEDDALSKLISQGGSVLKCRFCKNPDHMSAHCPYKDLVENSEQYDGEPNPVGGEDSMRQREADDKMKAGTYVPPSMRGGAIGAAARATVDMSRRDDFTARVTNLPEETTEDDLKEMFNQVGKVQRIYLAKDKVTMRCKGFAFVTYTNKEDAEKAIQTISGHRYDHLILKVEWAKPTN